MAKIGIIGTGSMGGMFIRKFIENGAVNANDVIACNRSMDKARSLADATGITVGKNNRDLVSRSDVIFLCVKPLDAKAVLREAGDLLTPEKLLISIVSGITIGDISSLTGARAVRAIPSITSECSKGITLLTFGMTATKADKELVRSLFQAISKPVETEEENFDLLADLTSCMPAFISSMMQEFALSASRRGGLSIELTELLVKETLAGTAELLTKDGSTFNELVVRVATKGGITEEGVKVIKREIPAMYDDLLEATSVKRGIVREKIKNNI